MAEEFHLPFTNGQLELIKLLDNNMSAHELEELKKLLISFKFRMVENRAEKIAEQNNWSTEDINSLSKDHSRRKV
jgi:thermostable 8-oxoguanine DNA glycosylase